MMDSAPQGEVPIPGQVIGGETVTAGGLEGGDWRTQLQPESRQRIANKIMETLKRHLPFSGQEGLQELEKIAVRFEEKIYTAATSQSDYRRKISLKMLRMETKSQNPMANSLQSNAASNSKNPQDPTSSDSSSQTGNASGGDWQEEIYQKIKSMHEMYYPELNEMYQRMAAKLQQHDALPQQPKNEQLEKLRFLKVLLERLIMFLQTKKNEIQPQHKDKIVAVEKQIVNILNSNMPWKPVSSLQQGQLTQPHMHAMQQSQQQQPQISQMHTNEGQMNSQMQSVNVQGPTVTTQQNNLTNLQHNSLSSVSNASNSRQNMTDSLQPGSNIDPGQDSSSQTGNASGGDWQEEIYQKIKSMHGIYYPELNEMCQQMAAKLQEHDTLPQQPKNEQLEKLRFLKVMLERLIMFLRTNKNEIQPQHKDKIVGVEKQIVNILNSNRPWTPVSSLQQGQLMQPHMHAMQQSQQQRPQISQMHTNEGQMNSQMQSMNVQGPTVSTQQNNLSNLQHNSLSSMSNVSSSRQNMDSLQSGSNIDPGQGNALNQMQQVAMSSLQQNPVSGPQLMNLSSISSQNGLTTLQPNVNPLQSNSNILQPQQIKREQQMFSAQQLKQQFHFQQRQMQQQYMHRLQLIQQQQQAAQQESGQLRAQQMMQLNQMNDANDVKMKHQMAGKSGVLPQHNSSGQRPSYHRLANDLRIIIHHVLILCFILLGLGWLANRIM